MQYLHNNSKILWNLYLNGSKRLFGKLPANRFIGDITHLQKLLTKLLSY